MYNDVGNFSDKFVKKYSELIEPKIIKLKRGRLSKAEIEEECNEEKELWEDEGYSV